MLLINSTLRQIVLPQFFFTITTSFTLSATIKSSDLSQFSDVTVKSPFHKTPENVPERVWTIVAFLPVEFHLDQHLFSRNDCLESYGSETEERWRLLILS